MELDRICMNCNSFLSAADDDESEFGVCLNDEAFEPYIDKLLEEADFSCCYDLYLEKRFNSDREPCSEFEEIELIEFENEEELKAILKHESMKHQDVSEVLEHLHSTNNEIIDYTINFLSRYIALGNKSALQGLLDYYTGLPAAENLEEVHRRMKILEVLSYSPASEEQLIDAYINELARSPSNNATRQLYTKILNYLERRPLEKIEEPLLKLMEKRKFSYKMNSRIQGIIDRGYEAQERAILREMFDDMISRKP